MRLSIIVPAFKVEDYIEKCIRSLAYQDLPQSEYEIIVTNDGSPDRSKEVVENLQKEFDNIILINQENQGVSMARNNAIAIAKGKYILPIDPDDYVLPNTLNRILTGAETKDLDVFYLGFEMFDAHQKSIWHTNFEALKNQTYNGVDGYFIARGYDVRDPDRSVAMLYKKSILEQYNIKYPQHVPYLEDGLFLAKVFAVVEKVGFDDVPFYQRTTRLGSATNSKLFYSEKAIQGFIYAIENIKSFASQNYLKQEQTFLIHHVIAEFLILSLSPSMSTFNFKEYFKIISLLKKANLSKLETQGLRFLYQNQIEMYNFSKLLFPFYFRVSNRLKYAFK